MTVLLGRQHKMRAILPFGKWTGPMQSFSYSSCRVVCAYGEEWESNKLQYTSVIVDAFKLTRLENQYMIVSAFKLVLISASLMRLLAQTAASVYPKNQPLELY